MSERVTFKVGDRVGVHGTIVEVHATPGGVEWPHLIVRFDLAGGFPAINFEDESVLAVGLDAITDLTTPSSAERTE